MAHDFGRFTWHELLSNDVEDTKGFYGELFGWTYDAMEMPQGTYTLIKVGEASIAGITAPPKGVPPHWTGYISVEDVDAAAAKAKKAGGKALMDAFDVPGVGRMQPIADPEGSGFFIFHSAEGDQDPAEGAGTWHWNELWSKDPGKTEKFYTEVFGYSVDTMPMPQGDYRILKNGEAPRGGLMGAPEGAPAHWTYYVTVDDTDATAKRAKQLGGKLVGELMDVPGVGRFGFIQDRQGVMLGIITPAN